MPSWIFSLQFRLVMSFALVLALALISVSLYIGFAAQQEVEQIRAATDRARASRVREAVARFYSDNDSWAGLQSVIERAGFLSSREIVVSDQDGEVVGDSRRHPFAPRSSGGDGPHFSSPIVAKGRQVGSVRIGLHDVRPRRTLRRGSSPSGPGDAADRFREPPLSRFAQAINRSLLWAGIATGSGGILLVSLVSRRALTTVRALSQAAGRLGRGDFSQRVPARSRDEIGQLGRAFNTMAEGLQNAERQRRNMVADVAHELRTPLSNIQGYIEAIRDGLLKPDASTLQTIHQQVRYLTELVEDLRLLAETEAEDFRLDRRPHSLAGVISESVEAFRPRAEAKGISVALEIEAGLPTVNIDRTRIEQVVGNLLENAIRHTPSAGIVTVSARVEADARVTVTIADSGEGVPPEALPFVFERFYRADFSRSRATGGAGLGLTIAKQLIEAHGGSIRATSEAGKGSKFIFELPLRLEAS